MTQNRFCSKFHNRGGEPPIHSGLEDKRPTILFTRMREPNQTAQPTRPPLSLLQLASTLRDTEFVQEFFQGYGEEKYKYDFNALILDLAAEKPDFDLEGYFAKVSRQYNLIAIGFTAVTPEFPAVIDAISLTKEVFPEVPTILGGFHATALPEETMKKAPEIDYLVTGRGEETLLELAMALAWDEDFNPKGIPGIYCRDGDDNLIKTAERCYQITPSDYPEHEYPMAAESMVLLNREGYDKTINEGAFVGPIAPITATRGCPHGCTYCAARVIWGKLDKHNILKGQVFIRNPEKVVEEMEKLYNDNDVISLRIGSEPRGYLFKMVWRMKRRLARWLLNGNDKVLGIKARDTILSLLSKIRIVKLEKGYRIFYFLDDTATINEGNTIKICEGIKERALDIAWVAMTRSDKVDRELLEIMRDSGCASLAIGVESGAPGVLNRMNKRVELEAIRHATRWIKNTGIKVRYYMMVYGSWREIDKSVRFILANHPDSLSVAITIPYPGSDIAREKEDEDRREIWTNEKVNYSSYMHSPHAGSQGVEAPKAIVRTRQMSSEEIAEARNLMANIFKYRNKPKKRDYYDKLLTERVKKELDHIDDLRVELVGKNNELNKALKVGANPDKPVDTRLKNLAKVVPALKTDEEKKKFDEFCWLVGIQPWKVRYCLLCATGASPPSGSRRAKKLQRRFLSLSATNAREVTSVKDNEQP